MSETINTQKKSQKSSSTISKRARKPKIEKIEEEQKVETNLKKPEVLSKWIIDEVNATKTCEICGAVMRGWAFREKFNFCPMCGNRAV